MSRAQTIVDHIAVKRLLDVAVDRFDRNGYHGTSVREIAADAGLNASAFYEHFPSKRAILREIVDATYAAAVAQTEAAVAAGGDDPVSRLEAAVWAECDVAIRWRRSWRIAETELVNLEAVDRERVQGQRDRLGRILSEIIDEGAASGAFDVDEPEATSHALTTMCAAIGSWYQPGGHEVPRQIGEAYCELAWRMAGVRLGSRRATHLSAVPARQTA
jgi:AcrR family transcriptional regulator